jgi:excisionase family DNA binding protein
MEQKRPPKWQGLTPEAPPAAGMRTKNKRQQLPPEKRPPEERILLRVTEAAYAIGGSRQWIYDLMKSGDLPFVKLGKGGATRIPKAALDELVARAMGKTA